MSVKANKVSSPAQTPALYTKHTRSFFVVKKQKRVLSPISDWVTTRNEKTYHTRPHPDRFLRSYTQREDNTHRGHFSLNTEPYKILGDTIFLDARDIILNVFGDKLTENALKKLGEALTLQSLYAGYPVLPKILEPTKEIEKFPPLPYFFPRSIIWTFVKESDNLTWMVKSNKCYEELIQNLFRKKYSETTVEASKDNMTIESISEGIISIDSHDSDESVADDEQKEVKSRTDLTVEAETISTSSLMTKDAAASHSASSISAKKFRRRNDRLKTLTSLCRLLEMLANMPNKHLRSKSTLSYPTMEGFLTSLKSQSTTPQAISKEGKLHTVQSIVQSVLQPSRLLQDPSIPSSAPLSVPSERVPPERVPSERVPSSRHTPFISKSSSKKVHTDVIETWEELVTLYEKKIKAKKLQPVIDVFTSELYKKRHPHPPENKMLITLAKQENVRKHPLWQIIMNEKPPELDSPPVKKKKSKKNDEPPKRSLVNEARFRLYHQAKTFRNTQQKLESKLQEVLLKRDRKKLSSLHMKFGTLGNLKTTDFYAKHRLYMKQIDMGNEEVEQVETERCPWMLKLKRDHSRYLQSDPEFQDVIQKLAQFTYIDDITPIFGRAKLCLLLMSLPAVEMCEIHTQKALKFILEEILLAEKGIFQKWMTARKIPSVIEPRTDDLLSQEEQHKKTPTPTPTQ